MTRSDKKPLDIYAGACYSVLHNGKCYGVGKGVKTELDSSR